MGVSRARIRPLTKNSDDPRARQSRFQQLSSSSAGPLEVAGVVVCGGDVEVAGQTEQADDRVPQRCQHWGSVVGAGLAAVLVEGDVADVVHGILDPPVAPQPSGNLLVVTMYTVSGVCLRRLWCREGTVRMRVTRRTCTAPGNPMPVAVSSSVACRVRVSSRPYWRDPVVRSRKWISFQGKALA
jgi:hypothetical protein